jgi:hypothetical protein
MSLFVGPKFVSFTKKSVSTSSEADDEATDGGATALTGSSAPTNQFILEATILIDGLDQKALLSKRFHDLPTFSVKDKLSNRLRGLSIENPAAECKEIKFNHSICPPSPFEYKPKSNSSSCIFSGSRKRVDIGDYGFSENSGYEGDFEIEAVF